MAGTNDIPTTTKALVLEKAVGEQSPVYHAARIVDRPLPQLKDQEILLRMEAVAFNHRDLWIRKGQYPSVAMGAVLGADGAGTVIASSRQGDDLLNKRVFMTPSRGWKTDPEGPEVKFGVIGGVKDPAIGTFAEYIVVDRDEVIETPTHLDDEHAAAWPLAGVTAWRAVNQKAQVKKDHNVLITGIGGGVALVTMQLVIALGANVYVTSGSQEKIDKAVKLGAKAGFNYKNETWSNDLANILKAGGATLDSVIDSAGGEILPQTAKLLKQGGKVVCYGMTASPKITFTMRDVLKNIELKGTSMGSQRELKEATDFIAQHKIVPIVSEILDGLASYEKGFEGMKHGSQFGKIVICMRKDHKGRL